MKNVIIVALLVSSLYAIPTPQWANKWQSEFNETYINNNTEVSKGWTLGTYSYNWNLESVVNLRDNGEWDLLCGSTAYGETPCADIVYQNNRYLYFSQKESCCICCNAEEGCGILKPNWMTNSEFVTSFQAAGTTVYEWLDTEDTFGGDTYYYQTESGAPYELYRTRLIDRTMYDLESYTEEFSDSVFELPAACNGVGNCGIPSLCVAFREGKDSIKNYRAL